MRSYLESLCSIADAYRTWRHRHGLFDLRAFLLRESMMAEIDRIL